jgi:hypothetical protein
VDIMSLDNLFKTRSGRQLFEHLPEIYRTRDTIGTEASGDLAKFLDACGHLMDLIRNTIDQQLADSFPDNSTTGAACQPWLLPYFADLLDVKMVSPDEKGRRDEIANAVAWRQRKGTLNVLEQIAEKVGRFEVEVQEGWKRTAITPRIGMPLLPAKALGEPEKFDDFGHHSIWRSGHPGLMSATVDIRCPSRAIQLPVPEGEIPRIPTAKKTCFKGTTLWWRHANPHGAPCFPESFEDVSRRTVDLRTPNWKQGHAHPKRVLIFMPPPMGFFEPGRFPNVNDMEFNNDQVHKVEDTIIDGTLRLKAGSLKLRRCAIRHLEITAPSPAGEPVLLAEDCLLGSADIHGMACLLYCTVLGDFHSNRLQASDSIFLNKVSLSTASFKEPHCIRFSRVPKGLSGPNLLTYRNTGEKPVFYEFEFVQNGQPSRRLPAFGEPGCATLHPASPEQIRFGAEDGGEMGVYHGWRYSLLMASVQDKLKDFLPVGIKAVIVPDLRLHQVPYKTHTNI